MHRLPGDAIWNHHWEPFELYRDPRGDEGMKFWWGELAKAFQDIPADKLTFNLLNELPNHWEKRAGRDHLRRSMMIGVDTVRAISPDRIIIIDGTSAGREFLDAMIDDPVCHSVHAYMPLEMSHVSHYGNSNTSWPVTDEQGRTLWGRNRLEVRYAPFAMAVALGRGVHCGEMGAQKELAAKYFLPWMKDNLEILKKYQIGYALWEFVGGFGLLDTGREGMRKEKFKGHELDIELLELLKAF
ncbi:MAG: glycoside hydrolase family 5 protein [Bacteroidales bacterium]|nr:glycoside hydrolase family 5 protein [Bacteroidales bacterium]